MIALVFGYEVVRDAAEFERVYGMDGEWAEFFGQGRGYIGTGLTPTDVEASAVVTSSSTAGSRWTRTTRSSAAHREEYMRRVDATRFHYDSELRFGTFETRT